MKKLKFLALAIIILPLAIQSCKTDKVVTPPVVVVSPAETVTAKPGDILTYEMVITSETDLTSAEFSVRFNGNIVVTKDSAFVAGTLAATIAINFTIPETLQDGDVLSLSFTATNTEQTIVTRTINIVIPPGEIYTYTAVIMSDLKNPEGKSFYSAEDNKLLNITEALAASGTVDLIYYYGATNKATLCAPADKEVEIFEDIHNESIVLKFTTRNDTRLAPVTMTLPEFDAITNDLTIKAKAPATTATAAKTLAIGNILWCETATGKKALIKVVNITGAQATSFITIEVKIQK